MKTEIKNRWTNKVIWESPCSTMRDAVIEAVSKHANLSDADLRGASLTGANLSRADLSRADLSGADLSGANLSDADLRGASLTGANLSDADLSGADLSDADLSYADLSRADLSRANLSRANLSRADLSRADLSGANLSGANLSSADLSSVRSDFLSEVLRLPNELEFLRAAIVEGRVNGSTYQGECACLAGTMAKAVGKTVEYSGQRIEGTEFTADASSPRERFFLAIKKGDTPETNGASVIALKWTDEAIAIRDNIRRTATKA